MFRLDAEPHVDGRKPGRFEPLPNVQRFRMPSAAAGDSHSQHAESAKAIDW